MRLTDCFSELVAYVNYFLKGLDQKQPPFEQVKTDIHRLLEESKSKALAAGISEQDYDLARFAICAWIDEAILSSKWKGKGQWQREQLQRLYYGTTDAGELFFEKLNAIGLQQRDVREVYYLCLAMGFTGRYIHEGDEYLLEQLKTSNLKVLLGSSVDLPSLERSQLFPEAYVAEGVEAPLEKEGGRRFSPMLLAIGAAPVVLLGILFLTYRFILNSVGESFLSTVP